MCQKCARNWWAKEDLNLHSVRNTLLRRARLPVPPLAQLPYHKMKVSDCRHQK
jgi:hypothetical protein